MDTRRGVRGLGRSLPRTTLIWVAAVVVVLVVVDVVLVTLALGRTAPEQNGPAGPIPTYSSTPRSPSSATPGASGTPTTPAEAGAADGASARHLLSAINGKEAWRASSGSCSAGQPVLEHSMDGGATWVAVALADDVRAVTALRAATDRLSVLAMVGDDCSPSVRTSVDGGATWSVGQPGAAGAGIRDASIVLSTGQVESPCAEPVDAYQGRYTTLVACGRQVSWRSGTGAWVAVPLPGIRAIADAGDTYTLARLGSSTCDGVQIVRLPAARVTAGSQVSPIGCWTDGGSAGPVAVDLAGSTLWAWAGDRVAVSVDGGKTW